ALVTEGIVDDDPNHAAGNQSGQNQGRQDNPQIVPLPGRRMEDGIGGVVMAFEGQSRGLPDAREGVWPQTDNPAGQKRLEVLEDLDAEAIAERFYQAGERGDKLIHGVDLRAVDNPEGCEQPQDKPATRDGPLPFALQGLLDKSESLVRS